MKTAPPDPVAQIPDPETVRVMLAEAIRRRDLLRSLLRVAVRKASYPPPTDRQPTDALDSQTAGQEVPRG